MAMTIYTNTLVYAEIGASSTDTATVTMTYGGTTSKQFNIFVQQIECSAQWRLATILKDLEAWAFNA